MGVDVAEGVAVGDKVGGMAVAVNVGRMAVLVALGGAEVANGKVAAGGVASAWQPDNIRPARNTAKNRRPTKCSSMKVNPCGPI